MKFSRQSVIILLYTIKTCNTSLEYIYHLFIMSSKQQTKKNETPKIIIIPPEEQKSNENFRSNKKKKNRPKHADKQVYLFDI